IQYEDQRLLFIMSVEVFYAFHLPSVTQPPLFTIWVNICFDQRCIPITTDYVGRIQTLNRIHTSGDATTNRIRRRTIDIQNLSDNIIGLSLWHEMATKFNVQEYKTIEKPVVIASALAPTHSVEVYFSSLDDDKSVSACAGIQVSVQTKQAARVYVDETSHCSISAQNDLGALLKRCKLIIWDEAPMANKLCFEALYHSLRDILRKNRYDTCQQPFGNMTMVFGSDFRQLTANMRLTVGARPEDVKEIHEFAELILKVEDSELG
ncbi:ATP-dependent DNA helicase PIF1-like protein, partial [Tanacetum coccineum]